MECVSQSLLCLFGFRRLRPLGTEQMLTQERACQVKELLESSVRAAPVQVAAMLDSVAYYVSLAACPLPKLSLLTLCVFGPTR